MEFYYSKSIEEGCFITLFTLDFSFESKDFHCLVRSKAKGSVVLYFLTILNEEGDEVFTKPYVLTERSRTLFIEAPIERSELTGLTFASVVALRQHLVLYHAADQFNERYTA